MGRRLQGTHPGLSADLQAVLQGQLVVLGGDDGPVEGDRDTPTSTVTAAGTVSDLRYLKAATYLLIAGMFPQKQRALWAGLTLMASTRTGLHCYMCAHTHTHTIIIKLQIQHVLHLWTQIYSISLKLIEKAGPQFIMSSKFIIESTGLNCKPSKINTIYQKISS